MPADGVAEKWARHRRDKAISEMNEDLELIDSNIKYVRRFIRMFRKGRTDLDTARQLIRQIEKASLRLSKRTLDAEREL